MMAGTFTIVSRQYLLESQHDVDLFSGHEGWENIFKSLCPLKHSVHVSFNNTSRIYFV